MRRASVARLLPALALLAACGGEVSARGAGGSPAGATAAATHAAAPDTAYRSAPGYVIDSILPIEEELRRFRAGLPAVDAFRGGAPTRGALVERFADALARSDTAALRGLALTRAEFAWFVYPESRYTRPPYRQPPGLVWMQLAETGEAGFRRLLARAAGGQLRVAGDDGCADAPAVEGATRLWRHCRVRVVRDGGDTTSAQLFGVIVERGGRFKLASYANDW
jgi:hypothetical protein